MNQDRVVPSDIVLKLTDGLQKGLAFDIAHRSAHLNNGNMRILGGEIPVEPALNLIGNMRDDLNRAAAVISPSFFVKDRPVNFSSGDI